MGMEENVEERDGREEGRGRGAYDKGRKRNRNTGEEIWRRKKGERKTIRGGKRGRERIIEERDKRKNGWRRE